MTTTPNEPQPKPYYSLDQSMPPSDGQAKATKKAANKDKRKRVRTQRLLGLAMTMLGLAIFAIVNALLLPATDATYEIPVGTSTKVKLADNVHYAVYGDGDISGCNFKGPQADTMPGGPTEVEASWQGHDMLIAFTTLSGGSFDVTCESTTESTLWLAPDVTKLSSSTQSSAAPKRYVFAAIMGAGGLALGAWALVRFRAQTAEEQALSTTPLQ